MNTPLSRFFSLLVLISALGLLVGCGGKGGNSDDHDDHADHHGHDDHEGTHGGAIVVSSDHKAHFEIVHHEDEKMVTLYVLDGNMAPRGIGDAPILNLVGEDGSVRITGVMTATTGEAAASEWNFSHDLLAGHPEGRFRVKIGSNTYTPKCSYEGHDHDGHGDTGPQDGMVAAFSGPSGEAGFLELKLHDDKGDLELWIASNEDITNPMDLPLGSKITVTFTQPKATTVVLQARNQDKNEDEDGKANNRDGKTNYFIFPGDTGADAAWLMGKSFEGQVTVTFSHGDKEFTTAAFELIPHSHDGHGGHDHD